MVRRIQKEAAKASFFRNSGVTDSRKQIHKESVAKLKSTIKQQTSDTRHGSPRALLPQNYYRDVVESSEKIDHLKNIKENLKSVSIALKNQPVATLDGPGTN